MAGKGDTPRPINRAKYESNYDLIFRCRLTPEQKAQEANENGATNCVTQDSMPAEGNSSAVEQTLPT